MKEKIGWGGEQVEGRRREGRIEEGERGKVFQGACCYEGSDKTQQNALTTEHYEQCIVSKFDSISTSLSVTAVTYVLSNNCI
jgi:hypothetical protein